ncbi:hypothetical protein [Streptomyces sp. NPDC002067]
MYPVSFARRLWFLSRMSGAGPARNHPLTVRLRGPLGRVALADARGGRTGCTDSRTVFAAALGRGATGRKRVGGAGAAPFVVRTAMEVPAGRAPGELARVFGVVSAADGTVNAVEAEGSGDRVSVPVPAVATGGLPAEPRRDGRAAADTREADLVPSG